MNRNNSTPRSDPIEAGDAPSAETTTRSEAKQRAEAKQQRKRRGKVVAPHKAPVYRTHSRAFSLPPVDATLIKVIPPVLIIAVVLAVLINPDGASNAIGAVRTVVTEYFTWFFVLYSVICVVLCGWVAFSRHGDIRLGGPKAEKEHSAFAWYSMLFACGQGIGLIFWSVAEPIMLQEENPIIPQEAGRATDGALAWTYMHWGFTAWAMYCAVALCLAYSHHNLGKTLTFREATVDLFPKPARRPIGVVVELLAIIATVLGLATSFGFATLQFSAGVAAVTGIPSTMAMWLVVVAVLGLFAAASAFFGVDKGMKRISETNSVLSVVLVVVVFIFGPTVYVLSTLLQSTGAFIQNFPLMSLWTDSFLAGQGIDSWQDSWNGWWTVFIWAWVIAFSPFVAGFIARISRGRTLREFVIGVTIIPTVIVMVWVGIIGGAAQYYDARTDGSVTAAMEVDTSAGLFQTLSNLPSVIGTIMLVVATVLVATYYVTSLDSGVHALSEFVSAPRHPGAIFRVVLVASIAAVAVTLLSIGGSDVLDTVQTGTILGAFPFAFVILAMFTNLVRRLQKLRPVRLRGTLPDHLALDSQEGVVPETPNDTAARSIADGSSSTPGTSTSPATKE